MVDELRSSMVRPQDQLVSHEVLAYCSRQLAMRYRVCPLHLAVNNGDRTLTLAAFDPTDLELMDTLQRLIGCRIKLAPATEQDILLGIATHYHNPAPGHAPDVKQQFAPVTPGPKAVTVGETTPVRAEALSAVNTVEGLLQRAMAERATDIHIEPHEKTVYVRFRIDGVLYDHLSYAPSQHAAVISRIKILSNLDISQSRLAQDGRFEITAGGLRCDVRVSVIPLISGQKAVLRLLSKGQSMLGLEELGMNAVSRQTLEALIRLPYGMIIATGPTGSGKTTTLYACISTMDAVQKNIQTIEDPVEYRFARVGQVQVHPKIGLTFAAGLRMLLRQDPDVIMVGEIRDLETLDIAIHSALTGHQVFTTLHCNDAAAGAARMVDMGAEPFLVASSVSGILAQRLIRKLCPSCKRPAPISENLRRQLALADDGTEYYRPVGCADCRNTGYFGRVSVFEVVPMDEAYQNAILRKASASEIRQLISEAGIPSMWDDGLAKAREGLTSLEEVMHAVYIGNL